MSRRRSTRSALMALAAAWLLLGHSRAAEACQTTTCSHSKDPACVRDPATLCWAAGEKVSWWQACTSFSLRAEGVPKLGLDYSATEALVLSAFERWTSASCGSQPPSIVVAPLGPIECSEVEYNPEGPNAGDGLVPGDRFGANLAVSADGQTYAVSSPSEDGPPE